MLIFNHFVRTFEISFFAMQFWFSMLSSVPEMNKIKRQNDKKSSNLLISSENAIFKMLVVN